jgi:hypothetical protein
MTPRSTQGESEIGCDSLWCGSTSLLEIAVCENKTKRPRQLGVLSTEPHSQPCAASVPGMRPSSAVHLFGERKRRKERKEERKERKGKGKKGEKKKIGKRGGVGG